MRFLNTRLSQETALDTSDNHSQEQGEAVLPQPGNLMNKFYRYQTIFNSEGPETFYENEAWAPENEGVGLFRKHRMKKVE